MRALTSELISKFLSYMWLLMLLLPRLHVCLRLF